VGRNIGPQCRLCRSQGYKLYLKGDRCKDQVPVTRKKGAPGKGPRSRTKKISDYGVQLHEKQKLKRMYGMLEGQFRLFFGKAVRHKGITGENLIQMLERRLDNIVYRLHLARPARRRGSWFSTVTFHQWPARLGASQLVRRTTRSRYGNPARSSPPSRKA